jgi:thioredoxin reductase (NADPH)
MRVDVRARVLQPVGDEGLGTGAHPHRPTSLPPACETVLTEDRSAAQSPSIYDCVIIGGGPAGLVAATYLARFQRKVMLLDAGASRARRIPETHNCPGFPDGIGGEALLARLRAQAEGVGVPPHPDRATCIVRDEVGFTVEGERGRYRCRTVIAATGIVDRLPDWSGIEEAIAAGIVRLCPLCDAYEAGDQRIAVFGLGKDCVSHAAFLRTWSRDVTAIHAPGDDPSDEHRRLARELGIEVLALTEADGCLEADAFRAGGDGPGSRRFDVVYVALGSIPRTGLFDSLQPETDANGELRIDAHGRTSVEGVYAIGDAVSALNQLSVAFGHAAVAASAIHQALPRNPL